MFSGRLLRWYRDQAVLTQRELAQRAGITVLSVSKLERGEQIARPSTIRKLARALGIKPQDLLEDDADDEGAA
jgi:transcriptional regulator with XRE-family HTH domain